MADGVLTGIAIAIPILALLLERLGGIGISERHHSHHDTYLIASSLSSALVVAMVFMGITGLLLAWLCNVGVFHADATVILGFFAAFLFVLFVIWLCIRRYRVATYDSCMIVTPFVGPATTVRYRDIESMEWGGIKSGTGYRNLNVYVGGKRVAMLWGVLDLEQILLRIDRFDVLASWN